MLHLSFLSPHHLFEVWLGPAEELLKGRNERLANIDKILLHARRHHGIRLENIPTLFPAVIMVPSMLMEKKWLADMNFSMAASRECKY